VRLLRMIAAVAMLLCALGSFDARADEGYPSRPITLMHGFGAGGNADAIARIVADGLSRRLAKAVIVEARPGAGGNIASDRVAKAPPDGYTLIMLTGGHAVSAALYKALPFDPVDDFQMISTVVFFPFVVAVKANHRFQTLADLIAEAKAKPDTLTYSSVGVGTTQHLVGELLSSVAGIKMIHVPYKGGGGPINDLLGGQIDILIDTLTITAPQLAAGNTGPRCDKSEAVVFNSRCATHRRDRSGLRGSIMARHRDQPKRSPTGRRTAQPRIACRA
jgi:tripartite-type tricarboxylate transporter receptor subunit TctC